jgi:hypothetical protein
MLNGIDRSLPRSLSATLIYSHERLFTRQAWCKHLALALRRYPPKRPHLSAVQLLKSTLSFDQHRSGIMTLLFLPVKRLSNFFV